MSNIDPKKIREEAAKNKQEVKAVVGDIVTPAVSEDGEEQETKQEESD
jgi:hypothetical protein